MIQVGVRELKSQLSYYIQLVQAGETIAVSVRNTIVGFFSAQLQPGPAPKERGGAAQRKIDKLAQQWQRDGFIVAGGAPYRYRPITPIQMQDGSATDMIRQLRDEAP